MASRGSIISSLAPQGARFESRERDPDPVELMLRVARRRALQSALMATLPLSAWGCHPSPQLVPKAMPSSPTVRPPMEPSVAPPEVAVVERVQCDESGFPVSAHNLKPILAVDYLAVRSASGIPNQGAAQDWTQTQFEVLSQRGDPCSSAPAGSTCKRQIEHHPAGFDNPQCLQTCREVSLVSTRGGEVRRWATAAELREFLAPIDTVDEALMLVQAEHYNVSCEAETTQARRMPQGYEVYATKMTSMCAPIIIMGYWLRVSDTGEVSELSSEERSRSEACVGRMPQGLGACEPSVVEDARASFLAQSAYLESASVLAFRRLAHELSEHGAPAHLIHAALRASDEEVRHAREVGELARAYGASAPSEPSLAFAGRRGLEEIAMENAIEGCVRETYGAMVGAFQALRARDARVRDVMEPIAEEELGHAALSHQVHAWLMERLDGEARARVAAAMSLAIARLKGHGPLRAVETTMELSLGLPSPLEAQTVLRQLDRDLWQPLLQRWS